MTLKHMNMKQNKYQQMLTGFVLLLSFCMCPDIIPARERGNANLKKMLHAGKIDFLPFTSIDQSDYHGLRSYASSYRAPEGKKPKKPKNMNLDTDYTDYDQMLDDYEDMYFPGNVYANPQKAWVEGVKGDGIGEVLVVKLDILNPVKIRNGFGKNTNLFKANNRVKKVRIYLLKANGINGAAFQYKNIEVLKSHVITLQDKNDYQKLPLPPLSKILKQALQQKSKDAGYGSRQGMFVAIEILSVYKGSKYSDTAISVVNN